MKDGYCENCPNPADCYLTGRCWPPNASTNHDMKTGIEIIAAERERQITAEGYTAAHDDEHDGMELAIAAGCYLDHYVYGFDIGDALYCARWPWEKDSWKPSRGEGVDFKIRDLAKVGAFAAAEIDRLTRMNAGSDAPGANERKMK